MTPDQYYLKVRQKYLHIKRGVNDMCVAGDSEISFIDRWHSSHDPQFIPRFNQFYIHRTSLNGGFPFAAA